jgi:hypothetical protein
MAERRRRRRRSGGMFWGIRREAVEMSHFWIGTIYLNATRNGVRVRFTDSGTRDK